MNLLQEFLGPRCTRARDDDPGAGALTGEDLGLPLDNADRHTIKESVGLIKCIPVDLEDDLGRAVAARDHLEIPPELVHRKPTDALLTDGEPSEASPPACTFVLLFMVHCGAQPLELDLVQTHS